MQSDIRNIRDFQKKGLDLNKWQNLVDMLADLFEAASGDIVQFRGDHFNVVSTSANSNNFVKTNDTWDWDSKTFCKYIVENDTGIYVGDALADDDWRHAPFVRNGVVRSYIGEPIYWPDGEIFGSFCVIDNKATNYPTRLKNILSQLKLLVEGELKQLVDLERFESAIKAKEQSQAQAELELKKRLETELQLQSNESIVATTLETLVDAVIRIEPSGEIVAVNSATVAMFQYSEQELLGQNISILMPTKHASKHKYYLDNHIFNGIKKVIGTGQTLKAKRKDGQELPVRISVSELTINGTRQFIGLVEDISKIVDYENKLKTQALQDTLTACANRLLLEQKLSYQIEESKRSGTGFTLAYIDLNKFKPINDQWGHKAGDEILINTSNRIKKCIRTTDLLARVGGDEFVILFNKLVEHEQIAKILTATIAKPISYKGSELSITASIGFADHPVDGTDMDKLMDKADRRMYKSKRG